MCKQRLLDSSPASSHGRSVMESTPEQKAALGAVLLRERTRSKLSGPAIAKELAERGFATSHQSYYQWEKGQGAPQTLDLLRALDDVLGAEGRVVSALLGDPVLVQRLDALDERLSRVEQMVQRLLDEEPEAP